MMSDASRAFDPSAGSTPDEVELTILMPCLNERSTIEACIATANRFLAGNDIAGEVLVADNGSTDGSQFLAARAGARVVVVLDRGYGAALLAGIAAARGRYVIMGDADESYDFARLDAMVASLRAGNALVMGNRFAGGIEAGAMPPLHRYLGNPVLSFLGRLLFSVPIGDFHCGLRGFSREAMNGLRLQCQGMEFASEMIVKAALHGLAVDEVPVRLARDGRGRKPHLNTWTDGWRHLRFLLMHSPRWLFLYPGLALVLIGLGGMSMLATGSVRLTPHVTLDVHTLVASCFATLIGTQFVMLGALARRWGMVEGFLPKSHGLRRFLFGMTLEAVLLGALAVLLCGLAGIGWAFASWMALGFGALEDPDVLRILVVSLTAICISVQSGAAAFFGSIMTIRVTR